MVYTNFTLTYTGGRYFRKSRFVNVRHGAYELYIISTRRKGFLSWAFGIAACIYYIRIGRLMKTDRQTDA